MDDLRLFSDIEGFSVEVVYVAGASDVFTNEGLSGLYSWLLSAWVSGEISGGGVGVDGTMATAVECAVRSPGETTTTS